MKQRVNTLIKHTISYCIEHKVGTVNVFCLGDLIDGILRIQARVADEQNIIQQTITAGETLSAVLLALSAHFNVKVYYTRDNHSRITPNKKESIAAENMQDIIKWFVSARLQNISNIVIKDNEYDPDIITATIAGQKVVAVHGEKDNPHNIIQNMTQLLRYIPDYAFLAHYHHSASDEVGGAEIIVNPSLAGVDDYATSLRRISKPAQKLLIFDGNGLLCQYKINLNS